MKYYIASVAIGIFLLSGCSAKNTVFPDPDADIKAAIEKNKFSSGTNSYDTKKIMPYQQKVSLMVGSRANDSKVVVNAGKVLKVFIASYKQKGTLIAGHDIYTYVEKPGFVVGENIPSRSTDSITTPLSKLPFDINRRELNINTSEEEMSNKDVKNYMNNLYKKRYGYQNKNMKKVTKIEKERDAALMNYIKEKKGNK